MRVPLDMTDSKRKRKYIEKICLYNYLKKRYVYTTVLHIVLIYMEKKEKQTFMKIYVYTTVLHNVLIYMKKKEKQMFMEMICLYNCFIHCI